MKRLLPAVGVPGVLGLSAIVFIVLLVLMALAFPTLVQRAADNMAGSDSGGDWGGVSAESVAAQVLAFWYVLGVLCVLGGVAFAGAVHLYQVVEARALMSRRRPPDRNLLWAGLVVVAVLLAVLATLLSHGAFVESKELERQAALFAWAARSWVGGMLVGLAFAVGSAVLGSLIHLAAVGLPQRLTRHRIERQLNRAGQREGGE